MRNEIVWVFGLLFVFLLGCAQSVSPCRQAEERACQETQVTVEHFNRLKGGEVYKVNDCLQLIDLRCSD